MTNVNTQVIDLYPNGGTTNGGFKLGYFTSVAKAAQNDTVTITNASAIQQVLLQISATGAGETYTIGTGTSSNVITCTSATTGNVKGVVLFKP